MRSREGSRLSRIRAYAAAAGVVGVVGVAATAAPANAGSVTDSVTTSVHVTSVSPGSEPKWGGDWITVTGSGFDQPGRRAVETVYFGDMRATHVHVLDDHTLEAMDPEVGGGRHSVPIVVRLRNGQRTRAAGAARFTYVVPTVRTPIHDGLSTLQSRALGATVIRRVSRTPAAPLAPRSPSWTLAEGLSAVARAERWLGMPYSWGGGNAAGPTMGSPRGNGLLGHFDAMFRGFDCSGLTLHAWAPYVRLPHSSGAQRAVAGRFRPTLDELQPGDLVFYSGGGPVVHHVVIYAGGGQVIQAPRSGHVVERSTLEEVSALEPQFLGTARPGSTGRTGAGPQVTSLSTSQGDPAGGGTLTIMGTNLDTTSRIRFGSTATYSFTVVSPTQVQVQVPPGHGTVSVRLGNAWGLSPDTAADDFTYATPAAAPDQANPGA